MISSLKCFETVKLYYMFTAAENKKNKVVPINEKSPINHYIIPKGIWWFWSVFQTFIENEEVKLEIFMDQNQPKNLKYSDLTWLINFSNNKKSFLFISNIYKLAVTRKSSPNGSGFLKFEYMYHVGIRDTSFCT